MNAFCKPMRGLLRGRPNGDDLPYGRFPLAASETGMLRFRLILPVTEVTSTIAC